MTWLLTFILDYLRKQATAAFYRAAEKKAEATKRGEINDENVKAYEEALTRKERIDAATDLLNRD